MLMLNQHAEERRSLLKKYYDDPKYNAAFDRCVDVMARLMLKYGSDVLARREKDAVRSIEADGQSADVNGGQKTLLQPEENRAA